jgi:peptide/nickel transport system substrate-binding protein
MSQQPLETGVRHRGRARHGYLFVFAVVSAVGILAASCGGDQAAENSPVVPSNQNTTSTEDPNLKPQTGGKLTFALSAETDGWTPASSQWSSSSLEVTLAIFDKLTAFDDAGNVQGYLAESVKPNADFTVWTIKLRPGIKFQNDEPVDATAVKMNLDAFKKSPLTSGAMTFVKAGDEGVTIVDPLTLTVSMTQPWSTYPVVLTGQTGTIAAPAQLADEKGALHPIGSGPFIFEQWTPGKNLTVKKNPSYWRSGFPLLDEIEFQPISDNQARGAAMRAGDIQGMESFSPELLAGFRDGSDASNFRFLRDPRSEVEEALVMLNMSTEPFNDPLARKALIQATDSQAVTDLLDNPGELEPAVGAFGKNSPWHVETDYPKFDVEAAKKTIAEYTAKTGKPLSFQLEGVPVPEIQKVEQALQQQWKAAGIEVTNTNNIEQPALIQKVILGTYQASLWRQFGTPGPDGEYVWWYGGNAHDPGQGLSLNMARNKDDEIDKALNAFRATDDLTKQKEDIAIVQKRQALDMPYDWLYHTDSLVITTNNVHDMTRFTMPNGEKGLGQVGVLHQWYQVWLSK